MPAENFITKTVGLPRALKRNIQIVADAFLAGVSFVLAMALRYDGFSFLGTRGVFDVLPPAMVTALAAFLALGLYRSVIRFLSGRALNSLAIGAAASALVMLATILLFDLPVPRSVPAIYFGLFFLSTAGIRYGVRNAYLAHRQDRRKPVAIYGAGEAGCQLLHALSQSGLYRPVFFMDYDPRLVHSVVAGLRVYPFEEAKSRLAAQGIEAILIALPDAPRAVRQNILEELSSVPVEVKTLPSFQAMLDGTADITDLKSVSIDDLLGRDPVPARPALMQRNILAKTVMVTGAGGSIGSELCRQILGQSPRRLILFEQNEYALYTIHAELTEALAESGAPIEILPILASVCDEVRLSEVLSRFPVDTVYHAAAYKHVPLVEMNVIQGLRNNVFGTECVARLAAQHAVRDVILISTDKAVRPTNFMGASKRMAELVCQAWAAQNTATRFSMVRFGNVLGSSGSVIPLFEKQIAAGGPLTVTHREINRYFMTITEAAQLVIQAGSMAKGGDVFLLDMGAPVKILDLAKKMARLHGLNPYVEGDEPACAGDIAIRITGLRPGEKLYEELLLQNNPQGTAHPRILTAQEGHLPPAALEALLHALDRACTDGDLDAVRAVVLETVREFAAAPDMTDLLWNVTGAPASGSGLQAARFGHLSLVRPN